MCDLDGSARRGRNFTSAAELPRFAQQRPIARATGHGEARRAATVINAITVRSIAAGIIAGERISYIFPVYVVNAVENGATPSAGRNVIVLCGEIIRTRNDVEPPLARRHNSSVLDAARVAIYHVDPTGSRVGDIRSVNLDISRVIHRDFPIASWSIVATQRFAPLDVDIARIRYPHVWVSGAIVESVRGHERVPYVHGGRSVDSDAYIGSDDTKAPDYYVSIVICDDAISRRYPGRILYPKSFDRRIVAHAYNSIGG